MCIFLVVVVAVDILEDDAEDMSENYVVDDDIHDDVDVDADDDVHDVDDVDVDDDVDEEKEGEEEDETDSRQKSNNPNLKGGEKVFLYLNKFPISWF